MSSSGSTDGLHANDSKLVTSQPRTTVTTPDSSQPIYPDVKIGPLASTGDLPSYARPRVFRGPRDTNLLLYATIIVIVLILLVIIFLAFTFGGTSL